jgi:hypothetical protein
VEGGSANTGRNLLGKGFHFLKRDVAIFAFFLLLSFFFWYLNSLRKDIEVDLRFPVRYLNTSSRRISDEELPDRLVFSIKGPGYSIFKQKLSLNRSSLTVDFSKVVLKRVPDSSPPDYAVVTNSLIPSFSKQLRSELQILSVKPDSIYVTFEKRNGTVKGTAVNGEKKN